MAAQKILLGSVSNNRSLARVEVWQRKSPDAIYPGILTVGDEFLRNSYDYAAEKTDDDDTISLKGERAQSLTKCKYLR
jgi:hypothetical protein